MRALAPFELLRVWELGTAQLAPRRALLLLEAACPDSAPADLQMLSVGQRDDLLLQLREATIGPNLEAVITCPDCQETLELMFQTDQLRQPPDAQSAIEHTITFESGGYNLKLRSLQAIDLVEVASLRDPAQGETYLLRRAVIGATKDDQPIRPEELPEAVVNEVGERLAEADPQADVELALCCPGCERPWAEPFDIVGFFWREIESVCARLLREVHTLAEAYGWSESEIISLNPAHRRFYLDLVAESRS